MKIFLDERDFTRWVIKEAEARFWQAKHPGNAQIVRGKGGKAVAHPDKSAAGLPDLILVHHDHGVVWAELKMPDTRGRLGELRAEQVVFLCTLREAGERVYVWGPQHQHEIEEVLDGDLSSSRLFDEAAV